MRDLVDRLSMTLRTRLAAVIRKVIPHPIVLMVGRLYGIFDEYGVVAYSQEGEDLLLRRMFGTRRQGFYVDVGAHHPMRFSNTCIFHRAGWQGINIDPDPEAMALFRRWRPGDVNLCVGISDAPGRLVYHCFNDHALNTFDATLAREREGIPGYHLEKTLEVPVRRLDEVLSEYLPSGQPIDFLTVDAEGLDLRILESNDWSRFRPICVLVEALGSSLTSISENPICRYLRGQGYELYAKTVNTLVFRDGSSEWSV